MNTQELMAKMETEDVVVCTVREFAVAYTQSVVTHTSIPDIWFKFNIFAENIHQEYKGYISEPVWKTPLDGETVRLEANTEGIDLPEYFEYTTDHFAWDGEVILARWGTEKAIECEEKIVESFYDPKAGSFQEIAKTIYDTFAEKSDIQAIAITMMSAPNSSHKIIVMNLCSRFGIQWRSRTAVDAVVHKLRQLDRGY